MKEKVHSATSVEDAIEQIDEREAALEELHFNAGHGTILQTKQKAK